MRIRVIASHGPSTEPAHRRGEPVTFGVPLPAGLMTDPRNWTLGKADRVASPVQTRVLDRWGDGSARWVLVDAQVDVEPNRDQTFYIDGDPSADSEARQGRSEITIIETAGKIEVNTGPARFEMAAGSAFPFTAVESDAKAAIDLPTSGLTITDAQGTEARPLIKRLEVEERGPKRSVVKLAGTVVLPAARAALDVVARVHFFAGLATVRLLLTITNPNRAKHPGNFWDLGDPGSVLIKDASLKLTMPAGGTWTLRASPEVGAAWDQYESPFELYQDSSGGDNWRSAAHINRERRVPNRFRGYRLRSGGSERSALRATPIVQLAGSGGVIGAAVPEFWQNFPKAIESDNGALTLRFFPQQYDDVHELQAGEQKTHICFLSFGPDDVTDDPLEWCRAPVVMCQEPSWCLSSGAVPWLGADDPDHAALVQVAVDGPDSFEHKREVVDEYGWRNFGDVYADHEAVRHKGTTPLVSHYNNQYDPIAGFIYQYFRTGDVRWWTMADELARHVVDIDVYHTDRDKWAYNHGLFWHTYHYGDADTSTHRIYPKAARRVIHGGGPAPDHNYTTGLMLHFLLTGNEASKQTATDLAQFVVDADDGGKTVLRWVSRAPTGYATASGSYAYHGPGRGPGNSLNALLDGHRLTHDARLLEKAEAIIRRVVHPTEDIARHRLDDPENKWFYLMFLQSLGKYLWRKAELGQLDAMYAYGRATLLHYAGWMAEHEYPYLEKPERLEFPTETWAAHEVRKSDVFCMAAMHTAGADRDRLVERGRFFFRNAVETLGNMPTRTLARPVIVLLSSGLVLPWLLAHPEGTVQPPTRTVTEFPAQMPFIGQKQIAKRRLRWIAIGVASISTLAVLVVLSWWLPR